jgi:hypothetical protein
MKMRWSKFSQAQQHQTKQHLSAKRRGMSANTPGAFDGRSHPEVAPLLANWAEFGGALKDRRDGAGELAVINSITNQRKNLLISGWLRQLLGFRRGD